MVGNIPEVIEANKLLEHMHKNKSFPQKKGANLIYQHKNIL